MREPRLLGRAADEGTVSVELASDSDRILIESLSQFYIYDFSEVEPSGSYEFEFDEQGGYSPLRGIDRYWRIEGFRALLIRVNNRLAGFALVDIRSRRGGRVEHNMAEFFVARKHRRRGVGSEAVRQILVRYPGLWEIAVVERNFAARAFWPRAIGAAPNVSGLVQADGDSEYWRGPIWTFRSATDDAGAGRRVARRECDAGTIHSVGASRGSRH